MARVGGARALEDVGMAGREGAREGGSEGGKGG